MKYLGKRKPTTWKPRSNVAAMKRAKTLTSGFRMSPRAPLSTRGWRPFTVGNTELKLFDTAPAVYQVNTTGSITLLAVPVTGADYNARIGRKIMLKSIYCRGYGYQETVASGISPIPNQARFMLVADMQPNGAVPSITDILNTADSISQLNLNNRDRFRILADKTFVLGPVAYVSTATQSAAIAGAPGPFQVKLYKRLNLEMIFNSVNGGTIADIASGALYAVWIGSRAAGATDANYYGSYRVRYADS